ncbi:MAG: YicC/YloC family endoribonuclease [Luteolibacter sp.]
MTGFGRGTAASAQWHVTVEIQSVNRKQLDVVFQAARELAELETRARKAVQSVISRGRVQLAVILERGEAAPAAMTVDAALARAFKKAFVELGAVVGETVRPTAADYLRQPGIVTAGGAAIGGDEAWAVIEPALAAALAAHTAMCEAEGAHLKHDLTERLAVLRGFVADISSLAPERPVRQREAMLRRLREAGLDIDLADERVLRELALYADRCDISEELTRLDSHFAKFRDYMDAPEPPGRALDFLCQEMFREFNTIGSKANDACIAQAIVKAKTELEKIREQVQNVE